MSVRENLVRLSGLSSRGVIAEIRCRFDLVKRLASIGIISGREVKVIGKGKDIILIEIENTMIVLERKTASSILCKGIKS